MPLTTADLITHPLRARLLVCLMGRELTTSQLARLLPEVPRASLYRQVRRLLDGGLIEVVRETPIRGTLEKVYGVRRDAGQIPGEDVEQASRADHLRHFTTFVDTMVDCYRAYLEGDDVDPREQVTMVATPLQVSQADYDRFKRDLGGLLHSYRARKAASGTRRIIWIAAVPDARDAGAP